MSGHQLTTTTAVLRITTSAMEEPWPGYEADLLADYRRLLGVIEANPPPPVGPTLDPDCTCLRAG